MIIKAMTVSNAAGKRFIANAASIQLAEFATILEQHFASRGYRVPTRVLPDWLVRVAAIFNPKTKPVVQTIGWTYSLSMEQAKSILSSCRNVSKNKRTSLRAGRRSKLTSRPITLRLRPM